MLIRQRRRWLYREMGIRLFSNSLQWDNVHCADIFNSFCASAQSSSRIGEIIYSVNNVHSPAIISRNYLSQVASQNS
jgi:hypothetical protein